MHRDVSKRRQLRRSESNPSSSSSSSSRRGASFTSSATPQQTDEQQALKNGLTVLEVVQLGGQREKMPMGTSICLKKIDNILDKDCIKKLLTLMVTISSS